MIVSKQEQRVKYSIEDFKESLAIAFTRLKAAEIFLTHYDLDQAITIAEIMHISKLKSRKLLIDFLNELNDFKLVDKQRANNRTTWKLNMEGRRMFEKIIKN